MNHHCHYFHHYHHYFHHLIITLKPSPQPPGFYIGVLDALAMGLVLSLAVWFERLVLPRAVRREAGTTVTPEAYTTLGRPGDGRGDGCGGMAMGK